MLRAKKIFYRLACSLIVCTALPALCQETTSSPAQSESTSDEALPITTPGTLKDSGPEPASSGQVNSERSSAEQAAASQAVTDAASLEEAALSEAANQARIKDLLSLVSDNTLFNHRRESLAYFALVKEVMRQTPEELRSRARDNPRFNEFYSKPAEHRGELVHLAINLRRVLPIEVKHNNEADVTKLYELWGWTDEAKAWMYCCITPELPPGLPTEGDVAERVEITGYFFKMQAYQPGDAAPNARNLVAPVVIGRVTRAPKPLDAAGDGGLGNWPLVLIVGFGIIIAFRLVMQVRNFGRSAPTHRNYRRRSLEPLDTDSLGESLGSSNKGLPIRNADE